MAILLLAAIGLISLLVGGIGVMNIMLVSVSERAREIGLRLAVGARQADIRRQFLLEAIVLCLIGAALGVLLCFLLILAANPFLPSGWSLELSPQAVLTATLCASLTGTIFGYFPARNAARLDPVEALARVSSARQPLLCVLALGTALALSSCAVGPDFETPAPPPAERFTKEPCSTSCSRRLRVRPIWSG